MTTFKWFGSLVLAATVVPTLFAESRCPGNVVSLPFRLVDGYKIVVPVSINHSGPYDFLLDTGTQMTIVGPALADGLQLKTQGAALVAGAGFHQSASFTNLDVIEAGTHSVANQKALVYGLLNLHSLDGHIRGILGEDFLEHFDMLIDYGHRLICIDDSAAMQAEIKGSRVPLVVSDETRDGTALPGLLIVTVRLSGERQPVRLMLDSGSNIPYLYNTTQRLAPQATAFGGRSLVGSGADGDHKVFSALPPQKVKVGSLELPEIAFLTLAYAQIDPLSRKFDGLLMMSVFRRVFISHVDHFAVLEPK